MAFHSSDVNFLGGGALGQKRPFIRRLVPSRPPLPPDWSGRADCKAFSLPGWSSRRAGCQKSEYLRLTTEVAVPLLLIHPEKWVVTCLISHSSLTFELQGQEPRPWALFFFSNAIRVLEGVKR